jgi:hypothetical protein
LPQLHDAKYIKTSYKFLKNICYIQDVPFERFFAESNKNRSKSIPRYIYSYLINPKIKTPALIMKAGDKSYITFTFTTSYHEGFYVRFCPGWSSGSPDFYLPSHPRCLGKSGNA